MILTENLQNPWRNPNIENKVKIKYYLRAVWTDCKQSLVCEKKKS
jgi:hypothetical protein